MLSILLQCMIFELRSDKVDCPWFVKLVEHVINHNPQRRLAGHAPVTVMTGLGLPADNPIVISDLLGNITAEWCFYIRGICRLCDPVLLISVRQTCGDPHMWLHFFGYPKVQRRGI